MTSEQLRASRRGFASVLLLSLGIVGLMGCEKPPPPPPETTGFRITDKFFDVKSLGNNSFILLGYRSSMAKSDDGGASWKKLTPPSKRNLTRLAFVDGKKGWGVGHEGIIFTTADGGETWTEQKSGTKNSLFDLSITSPTNIWAIGDQSSVVHTTDGGQTWTLKKVDISMIGVREDMTLAISDPIFYGVSCLDDNTCWVVGEFGQIRFTKDGGQTWDAQHGNLLGPKFRDIMGLPTFLCVRARDAQHAVAVGTYGAIASTSDGATWKLDESPVGAPLYDIRALPDGDYLIVGASGVVLRGNPESGWKPAQTPPGVFTWLSASDFDMQGHGVAGGGHGLLLTTTDFGKKWEWKVNG